MTPTKFQHAGLDWIPHTPGDPMPCPPDTLVRVLMRNDLNALCDVTNYETSASIWDWDVCPAEPMAEIVGWHPVEEQPPSLFRTTYEAKNGKLEKVKTEDLFVWAAVNTKTGEVSFSRIEPFNDELDALVEGWKWQRFRLVEAGNIEQAKHELRKELE